MGIVWYLFSWGQRPLFGLRRLFGRVSAIFTQALSPLVLSNVFVWTCIGQRAIIGCKGAVGRKDGDFILEEISVDCQIRFVE